MIDDASQPQPFDVEETPSGPRAPAFSDDDIAQRFAERHADELRYVAMWNRWLRWDGRRWEFDKTLAVFTLVRRVCREAASECNKPSEAKRIASGKTVAAVERLARADRRLAATVDQWDVDPFLLNTPSGIVDLRTGKVRPSRPDDYMTKITGVSPSGSCPRFKTFLKQVTASDKDKIGYLHRVLGYCLTGSTSEHAMFFGHGGGGNGKGTLVRAIAHVMGDYHATAPMETFTSSMVDRHPTELADLRGARLVTATETEEDRRWAEAKIKTLTGGDEIKARFMRQDFFEYMPQFKLFVTGNHKPGLRSVDEAIRRRLNIIEFKVTIPADQRDQQLDEKLMEEGAGILKWMIEGCVEWQRKGLAPPAVIREATDAYLEDEDEFKQWLSECCEENKGKWVPFSDLWTVWEQWSEASGVTTGSAKSLSKKLESHGFTKERKTKKGFAGLTVWEDAGPGLNEGERSVRRIWSPPPKPF